MLILIVEVLIFFSVLVSCFILLMLMKMKHKDISINLRTQLIFYDVLMEVVNIFAFYYVSVEETRTFSIWYSALIMSLLLYTRLLHTLLILTIAWCLFSIIVKQDFSVVRKLKQYTIRTNLITIITVLAFNFICFFSTDRSNASFMTVENMFYFFPSPFVLGFLVFYFVKVRQTLKNELEMQTDRICFKRVFAKHLIAYPMNYSLIVLISILILVFSVNKVDLNYNLLFTIGNVLFYVVYPIMNSVLYGITKSTKRFMCAFLLKDKNYEEEEEIIRILRESEMLREQYYLDLISRTEEFEYVSDNSRNTLILK